MTHGWAGPRRAVGAATMVLLTSMAACRGTKARPDPEACRAACEHTLELGMADLRASVASMGSAGGSIGTDLMSKAQASRESDLQTCQQHCAEGRLDARCAMQATTIDAVMACTRRR